MSRLLPVAAILVASLTPSLFTVTAQESFLALTHVAVVDVTAGRTIPDQTVLIRGNRIAAVGTTVPVPAGARQVNLSGKVILPGFSDMHAHAALAATQADGQSRRRTIETELLRRVREGVLGIRDMGGPFDALAELKRASSGEESLRPRVWLAGPPLTGPVGDPGFHWVVNTPAAARAAVERLAAAKVDFIKVHDWIQPQAYAEGDRRGAGKGP
jgi:hypothetical protein